MKPPDVLRIRLDGTLFCSDGQDVKEYMKAWACKMGVTEDTPVNVIRRDDLCLIDEDAFMFRNMAS